MAARCGLLFVLGALLLPLALSDIPGDMIQSLPGWEGALPTRQYSGYINVNATTGKNLYYWFVESENDPKNDPIVLWLNGGPGCSSMEGYFEEQGPLHFDPSTFNDTIPKLVRNEYTWVKLANMIFLEAPVGVGFSYSDTPSVDYHMDDNSTALDNYHFLVKWFQSYPEYSNNDFYITGESYAGIYVPTLVDTIRVMNTQTTANKINLKGFMVGNGCVGNEVGGCGRVSAIKIHVDFFHWHALFPQTLYDEIVKTCGDYQNMTLSCFGLLAQMMNIIGPVNIYDIYVPCAGNLTQPHSISRARHSIKELLLATVGKYHGPDECSVEADFVLLAYLNLPEVRNAIHAAPVEKTGQWADCTQKINYTENIASLLPIYPTLIQTYRTLIYNGDVDGCVPFNGNEEWTSGLGFPLKEGWRPWIVDDQVAGYVTEYDVNGFRFVTVKGSGHMVPEFKPKQAFALFQRYITGKPL